MNTEALLNSRQKAAIELYQPRPRIAYAIEATASLTDLPRHTILVYCKRGLISPVAASEESGYCYFDDQAIRAFYGASDISKSMHGISVRGMKEDGPGAD